MTGEGRKAEDVLRRWAAIQGAGKVMGDKLILDLIRQALIEGVNRSCRVPRAMPHLGSEVDRVVCHGSVALMHG